jgi:hypothetical protein
MVMKILEVGTRRGQTSLKVSGAMSVVSEGTVARLQAWKGEIVCGMKLRVNVVERGFGEAWPHPATAKVNK